VRSMGVPLGRARDTAESVCTTMGVDLEDCSIKQAGRREVLTVIVDKDGGIDLDEIAQISFAISEALDSIEELEEHPFVLEVSSPGTDRPLTEVRHWRRAVSRLVNVSFAGDRDDLLIRVQEVNGDQVVGIDSKATDGNENAVSFRVPEVDKAVIQIEFNREE
jgi:ribosome maturation factor RimP